MDLKTTPFLFEDNQQHLLSEFQKEKGYVLYFFPKAATPGCTLETIAYNKHYQEFLQKGYNVIGISRDNPKKQHQFKCDHTVVFPMLCDIDEKLCQHFDVMKQKKMFNNTFMATERSTFVVDNDFNILQAWRKVKPVDHIEDILKFLDK